MFNDIAHPPKSANDSSPKITKDDLTNKTPDEIRKMADEKGLKPFGDKDNPMYPKKWRDPITNKERLRIDETGHKNKITGEPYDNPPSAGKPHVHGYDENGYSIRDVAGDRHFPLANEEGIGLGSSAISALSRVSLGIGLLFWSEDAY